MEFLHHHRFFNILTFTIPLFCFLLSWAAASTSIFPLNTSPSPPLPPSSSALSAADILRARGYTLFASTIISTLSTTPGLSGTILAPPDFAFSFATAKFSPTNRRAPPRPSSSLLLFHTLKPPALKWLNLSSFSDDNDELPTLYNNLCLSFLKSPSGEISISSAKKPILAVKIRQPDLYVDDNLTVHGIDGVLDPATANKCSSFNDDSDDSTAQVQSKFVNRSFLDHAIRVLKRRGFNVAATALAVRRSELLSLTSVTVFAPSDKSLFLNDHDGFRYDFRHHVIPKRLRFDTLARFTSRMTAFKTLAVNKTVIVESVNGAVTVNRVSIDGKEIYHNRWIVLFAISRTLDDDGGLTNSEDDDGGLTNSEGTVALPAPETVVGQFPGEPSASVDAGTFPPEPEKVEGQIPGEPLFPLDAGIFPPESETEAGQHSAEPSIPLKNGVLPPAPASYLSDGRGDGPEMAPSISPAASDAFEAFCASGDLPIGVEGEDLFCPVTTPVRKLQENKASAAYVGQSKPLDRYYKLSEIFSLSPPSISLNEPAALNRGKDDQVNIADDLFFYV